MNWLKRLFGQSTTQSTDVRCEEPDDYEARLASRVKAFSSLLTPSDFANVGITGTSDPHANMDGLNNAYMTYTGTSGYMGGVELDVFVCEGDADEVFGTVNAESTGGADVEISELDGVQAVMCTVDRVKGSGKGAIINAKRGDLVFCLSIPDSTTVAKQLSELAALVVERFENLDL
ncbi:MAG: hypothetical protein ACR2NM_04040 [Bythopirellula sp.]